MKRKVRMKTCLAGVNTVIRPGDELLLDAETAKVWVAEGMAVFVDEAEGSGIETATVQAPEVTTVRPARRRKG